MCHCLLIQYIGLVSQKMIKIQKNTDVQGNNNLNILMHNTSEL